MRRPILADADRIVGEDPDHRQFHDRRQADRRPHIVAEDQEAGAIGAQHGQGQAIADGTHGVLANAEMQVAAAKVTRLEIARAFGRDQRLGGRRQIRRAADQPRQMRGDRILHLGRAVPAGQPLAVGREGGDRLVPAFGQLMALHPPQRIGRIAVLGAITLHQLLPCVPQLSAALADTIVEMRVDAIGHEKLGVLGPAVAALGEAHFLFTQGLAVGFPGVLLMRRAEADVAAHDDQRRPVPGRTELVQGRPECSGIVRVGDLMDRPAIGRKTRADILGESELGPALNRDVVGIVDPAEIRELQMAGDGRRLARDALHHVAVAAQRVNVVVEQLEAWAVEVLGEPARPDGHADAGGDTLAERPGGRLHASRQTVFRVTGAGAVELPKALQIVEPHRGPSAFACLHTTQVQHGVEQHRGMSTGQNEPVAIGPGWVTRIEAQILLPKRVRDRGQRHGRSRVARVRLLHSIHGKGADRVDAQYVDGPGSRFGKLTVARARDCRLCWNRHRIALCNRSTSEANFRLARKVALPCQAG